MIAKSCEKRPYDWDVQLPCLLFAYRASAQESTKESPFFLLYGRDPRIPTESALSYERSPYVIDPEDYKVELMSNLTDAWKNAQENIAKAQTHQKSQYDRHASENQVQVGDRVMVLMPSELQGKDRKLARPYHGPYRVLSVTPTNVEVRLVDDPKDPPIFVALNRVTKCYSELDDVVWTGPSKRVRRRKSGTVAPPDNTSRTSGPVTRSMTTQK